jgi:hypothetical protein
MELTYVVLIAIGSGLFGYFNCYLNVKMNGGTLGGRKFYQAVDECKKFQSEMKRKEELKSQQYQTLAVGLTEYYTLYIRWFKFYMQEELYKINDRTFEADCKSLYKKIISMRDELVNMRNNLSFHKTDQPLVGIINLLDAKGYQYQCKVVTYITILLNAYDKAAQYAKKEDPMAEQEAILTISKLERSFEKEMKPLVNEIDMLLEIFISYTRRGIDAEFLLPSVYDSSEKQLNVHHV